MIRIRKYSWDIFIGYLRRRHLSARLTVVPERFASIRPEAQLRADRFPHLTHVYQIISALISAMCVCALGVRALLVSVFCCFGPFCGRGRPQDLVERVGLGIPCRNKGSLPSGIGSEAIFGGGGPPRGSSLCHTKKTVFVFPSGP
jgi:hypothetical protein